MNVGIDNMTCQQRLFSDWQPKLLGCLFSRCTLAVILAALATVLTACNRLTPLQRSQRELATARTDVKLGKISESIIEYRRALQDDPKLEVAHFELGELYIGEGDYLNGSRHLTAAVDLDGSNFAARLALADILLLAHNYTDAKSQADEVLSARPDDTGALLVQAKSLAGLDQFNDAHTVVERVLKAEPENAGAWLLLAGVQFQDKDFAASESSFRRAIQLDHSQVSAVAAFTALLLRQKRAAEAEAVIRECIARNPKSLSARYVLAAFLWQEQRLPEAEVAFRDLSALGQSDPESRAALASFYVASRKLDLAEREYTQIVGTYRDDFQNRNALASLYLIVGKPSQAEPLLNQVLAMQPDNPEALLLRGQVRLQQMRFDDAIADLQHATRANPALAAPHYYLATTQLRKGQLQLAENELQTSLELQPDFQPARTLLAAIQIDAGDLRQSLANLDQVVENKPALIQPYIMRSMIIAENGDFEHAEKDLLPLLRQFPDRFAQAATLRALAWVRINQKKYEEGRAFLQRAEQVEPLSRETLYLLGLSYIQENKPDAALSLIRARLRDNPRWAEGYEVAGSLMLLASRYDAAETFFRQAISQDPQPASEWQGLGDALLLQSKYDQALDAFRKALDRSSQSADLYMRMAQIHDRKGEWDKAEEDYQKVLIFEPDDAVAKNNLAWDYAEHAGNMSVALRLAQEAANTRPDDPEISDTLGWVYLRMNTPDSAVRVLKDSVAKGPKNAEYSYHLGIAYFKTGNTAEAKRYLESALTLQPNFPQADDAKKILVSLRN